MPEPWTGSKCRSCDERIIWAKSATSGKAIPIDAEPVDNGNIRLGRDDDGLVAIYAGEGPGTRYVSHFATCPDRDGWRKP
jgi:hypothetical protein